MTLINSSTPSQLLQPSRGLKRVATNIPDQSCSPPPVIPVQAFKRIASVPARPCSPPPRVVPVQAVMTCFYATNNNQPHSVARTAHPAYPQKTCVTDDHVQWSVQCADYEPREFTADFVLTASWADPNDPNDFRCQVNMNPQLRDRFNTDPTSNRPMNPAGRTGMSGRGVLGKWGPNFAADPIVTRHHTQTGKLQVIAIKRKDTGAWALPGGMVDPGENVSVTARREFEEEAGNHEGADKALFEELVQQLFLKDNERHVYTGYVDDPRNTDNAWMETSAMHYHCNAQLASMLKTNAGDDAADVKWLDVAEDMELYANHRALVMQVYEATEQSFFENIGCL